MKRDIDFLYEIGTIRFIERMWRRFMNADFENLAEHHWRVIWIALIIAKHEGAKDTDKIMKMALIHDIPESRTGDVDYLSRQYVERNEDLGMADMVAGTALEDEILELWQEYEKRESIESKIVKDADNLDVDFELQEQASNGHAVGKVFDEVRSHVSSNKLYTKTAKKMWKQLQTSDPHSWHTQSRNRRNSGDWESSK